MEFFGQIIKQRGDAVENTKPFNERLREARAATGMSQRQMAERMLISKRNIEKWETGERVPPEYVQRFVLNELETIKKE